MAVLLAGQRFAFGQQYGSPPLPAATASATGDVFDKVPTYADVDAHASTGGAWGSAEYLLWWFKNGRVPPLVTAGGDGTLGAPGTRVLGDNLNSDDVRQGGRFVLGYHFETSPFSVETSYFFLSDRQTNLRFSSNGDPVLAQPFTNAVTGQPDASRAAFAGVAMGSVPIGARTGLWGAEANVTASLSRSDTFHLAVLGGFRFLWLDDEVTAGERFQVAPNVPGFGGNRVTLQDEFRTDNRFYGGQVGLEAGVQLARLTMDFRGKIALGPMHQVADIKGVTHVLSPTGATTLFQGGLYALRSNIGRHQRDELAFIPEVGLNVGFQLTPHLKLYGGYSFLWVNTVARAGEQIDPVVNVTQFPLRSGNGPLLGPARPAFHFDGTDFLAQGMNFGLELRY
jgi:Putative beta barrel porin-7 (BBP7)